MQALLASLQSLNNLHIIEAVERDCQACQVAPEDYRTSVEGYADLAARMEKLLKMAKLKENLLENQVSHPLPSHLSSVVLTTDDE